MLISKEEKRKITEQRKEYAIIELEKLGYELTYEDDDEINISYKGKTVSIFPYSGWFQGKSVKKGRGIKNLLKQLK